MPHTYAGHTVVTARPPQAGGQLSQRGRQICLSIAVVHGTFPLVTGGVEMHWLTGSPEMVRPNAQDESGLIAERQRAIDRVHVNQSPKDWIRVSS